MVYPQMEKHGISWLAVAPIFRRTPLVRQIFFVSSSFTLQQLHDPES